MKIDMSIPISQNYSTSMLAHNLESQPKQEMESENIIFHLN